MNQTLVWVVIAVVVIAGIVLYMRGGNDNGADTEEGVEDVEDEEGEAGATFRSLLASRTSQQCTFEDEETNSAGTIFVANGKMRGDFTAQANGGTTNGHIIVDDNTVYTWVDGMSTGFKMSLEATAEADAQQQVDLDREVDVDCDERPVDSSRFTLPSGVVFTDLSAVIGQ